MPTYPLPRSEVDMFEAIARSLTTVSAEWEGKPDHEIYVRLFELCLLPGRKEVSTGRQGVVFERVGNHLLPIERRIRSGGVSQADRQRLRDQQDRCVHAVAEFFVVHEDLPRYV